MRVTTLAESLGLAAAATPAEAAIDAQLELEAIEVDPNISTKELLSRMLETKAYRRSIYMRLVNGSLPPAVECKIYDHVMGKPIDRVEFKDKTEDVESLTLEELHERQEQNILAMQKILVAKAREDAKLQD